MNRPIVVIGGGPAGTTAGTLLTRHGHHVILLEKEIFPRFHVGESLLPVTQHIWSRLGLTEQLREAGYVKKMAGEIRLGKSPDDPSFYYSRMDFTNVPRRVQQEIPWSYHVERAVFDHLLLKHARKMGVEVIEQAKVRDVEPGVIPRVTWTDAAGDAHVTDAAYVIDASGRHSLLARKLGLLQKETLYCTASVFGHFKGISWPDGLPGGFINVYIIENGWVWFIPQAEDVTSVGVVMNEPGSVHWPKDPEAALRDVIGRYAYLRVRFERALQVKPVRILRNLPYHATRLVGEGFALAGDAAFFVDPIHSSGVHLAFYSAEAVADAVHAHLNGDRQALDAYQRKVKRHHRMVRYNVSLYYRVVVRYRAMAWMLVWMTGKLFRHWSGPWLNRINAWSFGHYSSFSVALGTLWAMALIGRVGIGALLKLTGRSRWGRHGYPAARPVTFDIPRAPEIMAERLTRRRAIGDGHLEPQVFGVEGQGVGV